MEGTIKIVFLLLAGLIVTPSFADVSFDLDQVKRCDPVFCPTDASIKADIDAAREHASRSGIMIESFRGSTDVSSGILTIPFNGDRPPAPRQRQGGATEPVSNFENSSVSNTNNGNQQNTTDTDQQRAFDQSSQESGITGLESGDHSGGQTMVKGGLLYSNHDASPNPKAEFKDRGNPDTVTPPKLGGGSSAVMLNRRNSSLTASKEQSSKKERNSQRALASMGGGMSEGFSATGDDGAVRPGGGSANASGGNLLDRLAGIAKGLGDRFFGLSGSATGHSPRAQSSAAQAEKDRLKHLTALNKNNPNFQAMLQKYMRGRGLASSLEFGAKDSFLFGRVCQQYLKYAIENGIPNDRGHCPKQ